MSPRRPPAPGAGGIPDPAGGARAPRARVGGPGTSAASSSSAAAKKAAAQPVRKTAAKAVPPVKKSAAQPSKKAAVQAAKKKQAAAQRARTVAAGSPISHTPHKNAAKKRSRTTAPRTTASRSGGLRPTSTRPGSARPRAGSAGRGARKRGLIIGTGRPIWVLGAVMAMLALLILPYFQKWLVQRSEIEAMRAEVSQTEDDVAALRKQQERWKDDNYVRAQARARLNYVMPGETPYVVSDPAPSAASGTETGGESAVPAGNQSWFSDIWVSAQAAGSEGKAQATTEVP